jgi:hypothetical protein
MIDEMFASLQKAVVKSRHDVTRACATLALLALFGSACLGFGAFAGYLELSSAFGAVAAASFLCGACGIIVFRSWPFQPGGGEPGVCAVTPCRRHFLRRKIFLLSLKARLPRVPSATRTSSWRQSGWGEAWRLWTLSSWRSPAALSPRDGSANRRRKIEQRRCASLRRKRTLLCD